jgi:hypothetical protein
MILTEPGRSSSRTVKSAVTLLWLARSQSSREALERLSADNIIWVASEDPKVVPEVLTYRVYRDASNKTKDFYKMRAATCHSYCVFPPAPAPDVELQQPTNEDGDSDSDTFYSLDGNDTDEERENMGQDGQQTFEE